MTPPMEPLGTRMAQAMHATTGALPRDTPEHIRIAYETDARVAREVAAAQLSSYAESLLGACLRAGHPGATPPREGRPGVGCRSCKAKLRHVRECAAIIAPDK